MANELLRIETLFKELILKNYITFPAKREKLDASKKHGVYIISNKGGKVLHVGRTQRAKNGIHQRISDHLAGSSSFVISYLKKNKEVLRKKCQYKFLDVQDERTRALLEAYAIAHLCPAHLGLGKKILTKRR